MSSFAFDTKKHGKTVLSALHNALFSWRTVDFGRLHEELVPSRLCCMFSRRHLGTIHGGVEIWSFRSSSNVILIAARNKLEKNVSVGVQVDVKVGCVRYSGDLGESLLKPDLELSKIAQKEDENKSKNKEINVKRPWQPKRNRRRARAKWRSYKVNVKLKSKSEQIIMIVSGTSRMFQVGKIQFEDATASSNIITNSLNSWLGTVNSWLVGKNDEGVRSCLFEPLPLVHDRVVTLNNRVLEASRDDDLKRALEASRLEQQERRKRRKSQEEEELRRALELSMMKQQSSNNTVVDLCSDDDDSDCVVVDMTGDDKDETTSSRVVEIDMCDDEEEELPKEEDETKKQGEDKPEKPDMETLRMLRLKRFQRDT